LMDIIVKDATCRSVVNAVVGPWQQLTAAMVLAVFAIYIFAMVIFKYFAHDFNYSDDPSHYGGLDCRTLWGCFKVSVNYGLRLSGGIGDIMTHTNDIRLVLDLAYFLIILIVLLNIIFGIILDTFSADRERLNAREKDTTEKCFICGEDRKVFESKLNEAQAFRNHIRQDHFMWSYLNFIFFIWEQDRDDDDGLELYVRKLIESRDVAWFPSGRAMILNDDDEKEESIQSLICNLQKSLLDVIEQNTNNQQKTLALTAEGLDKAVQKVHDLVQATSTQRRALSRG